MRVTFLIFLILALACDDNESNAIQSLNGTYEGTFSRSSPWTKYQSSKVTLTFDANSFEGSSSIARYPSICHGTFITKGQTIEFVDICVWTADFDWSYILSGTYNISGDENEIIIARGYDGLVRDTYTLKKQ